MAKSFKFYLIVLTFIVEETELLTYLKYFNTFIK